MKKIALLGTIVLACAFPFTARASDCIPYIAMPMGIGYAIDAKGNHQPNALCVHDAVFAPHPQYPNQLRSNIGDSAAWSRYKGDGVYRLDIDLNTGRVSRVTIIKSAGSKILDATSTDTFKRWVFRPNKWKEITIPITVRTKWVGVVNKTG
jgi:TonB family protein